MLFNELNELGVDRVLPRAVSTRLSSENLHTMLEDRAGGSAIRDGMAEAIAAIDAMLSTGLHDWWQFAVLHLRSSDKEAVVFSSKGVP